MLIVDVLHVVIVMSVLQYMQSYSTTVPQYHSTQYSTAHSTHSTTVPQYHSTTVQYHSHTAPQYHSTTVHSSSASRARARVRVRVCHVHTYVYMLHDVACCMCLSHMYAVTDMYAHVTHTGTWHTVLCTVVLWYCGTV